MYHVSCDYVRRHMLLWQLLEVVSSSLIFLVFVRAQQQFSLTVVDRATGYWYYLRVLLFQYDSTYFNMIVLVCLIYTATSYL